VIPGYAEDGDRQFVEELSLDRVHGVSLRLVHAVCSDASVARVAMRATGAAFPCQRLYRIGYGGVVAGVDGQAHGAAR
jgi:hypothetical protein